MLVPDDYEGVGDAVALLVEFTGGKVVLWCSVQQFHGFYGFGEQFQQLVGVVDHLAEFCAALFQEWVVLVLRGQRLGWLADWFGAVALELLLLFQLVQVDLGQIDEFYRDCLLYARDLLLVDLRQFLKLRWYRELGKRFIHRPSRHSLQPFLIDTADQVYHFKWQPIGGKPELEVHVFLSDLGDEFNKQLVDFVLDLVELWDVLAGVLVDQTLELWPLNFLACLVVVTALGTGLHALLAHSARVRAFWVNTQRKAGLMTLTIERLIHETLVECSWD